MTTIQAIEYLMKNTDSICKAKTSKNTYNIYMRVFISGESYKFLMCFEENNIKTENMGSDLFEGTDKTIKKRYDIPMECKWDIINDKNLMAMLN